MRSPLRLIVLGCWVALTSAGGAHAAPRAKVSGGRVLRLGRSLGSPTDGHLLGGAHLEETPYLRIEPADASGDVRWGLEPLVDLLDHAARAVRREFADAVLSVGHLSRPGGGEIDRHASHESGRDADVGFYITSFSGKPLYGEHFVAFRGDGTAPSWPGAHFDDARNWALVSALVGDMRARITHIFVASPLRARLLAYAQKIGAPLALRSRAAELMAQPRGALPHDDHFHVRIGCPSGMDGCIEQPTKPRGKGLVRRRASVYGHAHAPGHEDGRVHVHDRESGDDGRTEHEEGHGAEPSAPPALMPEPIEDADGPLSMRERDDSERLR